MKNEIAQRLRCRVPIGALRLSQKICSSGLAIHVTASLVLLSVCVGCQPGIQWRAYNYREDAIARDAGEKSRFVYFRHWAVPSCTKFEETVLLDPAVKNATNAYFCIVLAYNVDKHLADAWNISEPPGVAILGPDGKLLASGSGFMKREEMLALFQRADRERAAARTTGMNSETP